MTQNEKDALNKQDTLAAIFHIGRDTDQTGTTGLCSSHCCHIQAS